MNFRFSEEEEAARELAGQILEDATSFDRMREVAGSGEPLPGDVTDPYAVLDLSAACPGEPRVEAPLPPRWPALSQSAGDVS